MFKCTECGSEYEVKPDYCDCGNDVFVEEKPKQAEKPKEIKKEVKPEKPKPQAEPKAEPVSQKINFPKTDPISLTIFGICIFLSFIVVFFLFNPKETEETTSTEPTVSKNIPSIEKLWKDPAPVVVKQEEPKPAPESIVKKVVAPAAKPTQNPVQKQTTATKPKTTQTPKQNTTVTTKKQTTTTTAPANAVKKAEEEARKAAEEAAKKYAEVKKAAEDSQTSMFAKQELTSYKANLRNTLGKRIDFTRVVGDGDCAISFKIDASGKLINGAFTKQSSNITLNDAVYKAFMQSRTYNPPPSGYKGETITLKVQFYNGNFSISLN